MQDDMCFAMISRLCHSLTKFKVALSSLSERRALHVVPYKIKVSALLLFSDDVQQFCYHPAQSSYRGPQLIEVLVTQRLL